MGPVSSLSPVASGSCVRIHRRVYPINSKVHLPSIFQGFFFTEILTHKLLVVASYKIAPNSHFLLNIILINQSSKSFIPFLQCPFIFNSFSFHQVHFSFSFIILPHVVRLATLSQLTLLQQIREIIFGEECLTHSFSHSNNIEMPWADLTSFYTNHIPRRNMIDTLNRLRPRS